MSARIDNCFKNNLSNYSGDNLKATKKITGNDPAYIMFTSGSTGMPKGALMSHENVLKFIQIYRA